MACRFLRCLFGCSDFALRKGILNDLDTATIASVKLNEQWYCYGIDNLKELIKRGVKDIVLMDSKPLSTFGSHGERDPSHYDTINYGSNFFRHRYPAIEKALKSYEAVVMLDLDTVAVKPVPDDFWQNMSRGHEFQCVLRHGKQPLASWRKSGQGYVPCGSLTYWRWQKTIKKMNELYAEYPDRWDPIVLASMTDWFVPWEGPDNYKAKGLEPFCHRITEGKQAFLPEDEIFRSGRKKGLRSIAKTSRL